MCCFQNGILYCDGSISLHPPPHLPPPSLFFLLVLHMSLCCPMQANADPSVISCMHNLSRRIAIALQHEERRCQYLTREAKLMLAMQDEITTMTESESFRQLASAFHSPLSPLFTPHIPLFL